MNTRRLLGSARMAVFCGSLTVAGGCGGPCWDAIVQYDGNTQGALWLQFLDSNGQPMARVSLARSSVDRQFPFHDSQWYGVEPAVCPTAVRYWIDTTGHAADRCHNFDRLSECGPLPGEPRGVAMSVGQAWPITVRLSIPEPGR